MVKNSKKEIDESLVRKLAKLLEETGLTEIEYGNDDWHIRVSSTLQQFSSNISAPYPTPKIVGNDATPTPKEKSETDLSNALTSPMVGVVFTSSDPQSPPFVKIGDQVSEGQTLLLIEAMKVFNPITAPRAGKITQILITDGAPVEFGEPLLNIE
jgi:acetyl-CoA carboxylase biotin carboxyl carrier protein